MKSLRFIHNRGPWALVVLLSLLLAGCGDSSPEEASRKAVGKGDTYYNAGLYKEALAQYQTALDTNSTEGRIHLAVARCQEKLGLATEALASYNHAIELAPDLAEAYRGKAALLLQEDKSKEAARFLDELRAKPEMESLVLYLEGEMAAKDGRPAEAVESLRKALAKDPTLDAAARSLAQLLQDMGHPEEALAVLEGLSARLPNDYWVTTNLANLYDQQGQTAKAVELLTQLAQRYPSTASVQAQLAAAYLTQGNLVEAEKILNQALALDPADPASLYVSGQLSQKKGETQKALEAFTRAAERRPENQAFQDALREAQRATGNLQDKARILEERISQEGENTANLVSLAEAYLYRGEPDLAEKAVAKALELEPANPEAKVLETLTLFLQRRVSEARDQLDGLTTSADPRVGVLKGLLENDSQALAEGVARLASATPTAAWGDFFEALGHLSANRIDQGFVALDELIGRSPDFAMPYYELAQLYLGLNERVLAMVLYQRLIERYPDSRKPKLLLARLLADSGNTERALVLVHGVLEEAPEYGPAKFLLANIQVLRRDYPAAEKVYEELIQETPEGAVTQRLYRGVLAKTYVLDRRYDLAAATYAKILADNPPDTAAAIEKALAEMAGERLQEALLSCEQAVAEGSEVALLKIAQAALLSQTGKSDQALALFEANRAEVAQSPDLVRALDALYAAMQIAAGRPDPAQQTLAASGLHPRLLAYFESTLELAAGGQTDLAPFVRGLVFTLYRWPDAALNLFKAFYDSNPKNPLAIAYLGEAQKNAGQLEEAFQIYTQGVALDPEDAYFLRSRAAIASLLKNYDQANRDYLSCIAQSPEDPGLQFELGQVYENQKLKDDAVAAYRRALKLNPNPLLLSSIYNNLAWLLSQDETTLPEAVEFAKKALESFPEEGSQPDIKGNILDTAGWIYFKNGDLEGARKQIELALQNIPNQPTITYHLGRVFEQMGQPKVALHYYIKALDFNPNFPEAEELRPRIGVLRSKIEE